MLRVDAPPLSQSGKRYAVEVAGATALHEPSNAQSVLADDSIEHLYVIGLTKAVTEEVRTLFKDIPGLAGNPRLTVMSFSDAMKHEWHLQ